MKKQHVQLTENDRTYLKELLSKGELAVKTYKRALALLELDRGKTYTAVAKTIQASHITVSKWSRKYADVGLNILIDQPRSGRPPEIDGVQRAKVTALACSDPPEGYARWSLRMLADRAVELDYVEHISHTQVGEILTPALAGGAREKTI
jgi:transposase